MGESLDQRKGTVGPPGAHADPPPPPTLVTWPPRPARVPRPTVRPSRAAERRAIAVAVVLAIVFAAPITWSLEQPPAQSSASHLAFVPVDPGRLFAIVAAAAVLSALIAGGVATLAVRRWTVPAALIALIGGWLIAASLVPAFAAWSNLPLMAGSYCIDGCGWAIQPGRPADGITQALIVPIFAVATLQPGVAAAGLLLTAVLLSRSGRPLLAVVATGLAWTAAYFWAVMFSVAIPFLLQVLGVVVWAAVLWEPWRRRGAPDVKSV